MDPKVTKLMDKVGVENIAQFRSAEKISAVRALQDCYSKSTLEDYTFRLIKELKTVPDFPKKKITEYRKIWRENGGVAAYKKKTTGNKTGRPIGTKNKC
jgi:hypothetical protein